MSQEVREWLSAAKMNSYAQQLIDLGYDSIYDLKRMPASEVEDMLSELSNSGMRKPHANRLRREISSLQSIFRASAEGQQHAARLAALSSDAKPSPPHAGVSGASKAAASVGWSGSDLSGGNDHGDVDLDFSKLCEGLKGRTKKIFPTLTFARYLASCHIVLNHFYAFFQTGEQGGGGKGGGMVEHDWSAVASWGFTWASFFFTLSGFVLAHSQAMKSPPSRHSSTTSSSLSTPSSSLPTQFDFFKRRLTTIWPLYMATLVLSGWNWPADRFPEGSRWWEVFSSMALLLHAWVPSRGYVIKNTFNQSPTWFLSVNLFNWAIFTRTFAAINKLNRYSTWVVLGSCYSFAFVPYVVVSRILLLDLWETVGARAVVLYNPLMHVHSFVAGVALSRLLLLYTATAKKPSDLSTVVVFGACIGYCGILAVMAVDAACLGLLRTEYYLVWRHAGLMPLHCLIIVGLAIGKDPLARLFAQPVLVRWGEISYAQYLLQTPTFRAVSMWCIGTGWNRYHIFPPILTLFSFFATYFFANVYTAYIRLPSSSSLISSTLTTETDITLTSSSQDPVYGKNEFGLSPLQSSEEGSIEETPRSKSSGDSLTDTVDDSNA